MDVIVENLALYRDGLLKTLQICLLAALGSLALGTLLAIARVSPVPPLRWLGTGYVTVFRNSPLAVVLFFVAFGFPEVGLNAEYFTFGVVGLTLYTAAFVCEAVRSGVNSVPAGQAEAARAIGLGFGSSLRHVVLPQALRTVVPPLGSVLIAMTKNSAIVGAFGVGGELFSVSATLTGSRGEAALPVLLGVIGGYLLIILPAGYLLARLERGVAVAR